MKILITLITTLIFLGTSVPSFAQDTQESGTSAAHSMKKKHKKHKKKGKKHKKSKKSKKKKTTSNETGAPLSDESNMGEGSN